METKTRRSYWELEARRCVCKLRSRNPCPPERDQVWPLQQRSGLFWTLPARCVVRDEARSQTNNHDRRCPPFGTQRPH